jgi:hypothetical protein
MTDMNRFRRLLLGAGQMPAELKTALAADGLVLLEEGVSGSVTYRHYRAPGEYASFKKQAVNAAVGVSAHRVIVWDGRIRQVDGPPGLLIAGGLTVAAPEPDDLHISYDAARFSTQRSGSVDIRLRTAQAGRIVSLLTEVP